MGAIVPPMRMVGRYALHEPPLGEGSFGEVYEADDTRLPRRVAVKLLHAKHAVNPKVKARFHRELEAACRVAHENVIQVIDVGEEAGLGLYYVMELVRGTPLSDLLVGQPFAWARILPVARQMAAALEAIHAAGIVHRDMKPGNVMLVDRGDRGELVKLLDFGIAWVEQIDDESREDLTGTEMVVGTPAYMSPEQTYMRADRERLRLVVDRRSDLYSLGTILYEMAAGHRPFGGDHIELVLAHRQTEAVPLHRVGGVEVPRAFCDLVERLMAKRPEERPADAAAVLDALAEMEQSQSAATRMVERRPVTLNNAATEVGQALAVGTSEAAIEADIDLALGFRRPLWPLWAAIALILGLVAAFALWPSASEAPAGAEAGQASEAAVDAPTEPTTSPDASTGAPVSPFDAGATGAETAAAAPDAAATAADAVVAPEVVAPVAAPTTATLQISSDPPGAAVSVDGAAAGTTPLNLDVESTSRRSIQLTFSRDGYRDRRVPIRLDPTLAGTVVVVREQLQKRGRPGGTGSPPTTRDPFEDL
jgi:predicted metal-dependent HD superfamily phosphohydrolase